MTQLRYLVVVLLAACSSHHEPTPPPATVPTPPPSASATAPSPASVPWQRPKPIDGNTPIVLDENTGIAECDRAAHLLNELTHCPMRDVEHDLFQLEASVLGLHWPAPGARLSREQRKFLTSQCKTGLPTLERIANSTHCVH